LSGRIQVLTANVPYVPRDEIDMMPPEARLHERPSALDGGVDGLDVLRQVAASAPSWLRPGGHLLVEMSEAQVPTAIEIMRSAGLKASAHESDDLFASVVIGTRGPVQT
jgi:release factor glutamine methyltransferase